MNVLFLLLSLPAAASAVKSFRGTDAAFHVTCPLKDYVASPCAPALAVPPEECSNLQACALEYTPPSNHSLVVIPLTCSCLELKDCPDTCTAGVDFVGPGTVTCDKNDFLLSPCLPVKTDDCEEDAVEAAYRSSCDTDFVPPPEDTNAVTLDIPLPCGCVKVRDCPMSCTFSETVAVVEDPKDTTEEAPGDTKETDLLNFRGPGVVVCPIMTYEANPCCKFGSVDNHESQLKKYSALTCFELCFFHHRPIVCH